MSCNAQCIFLNSLTAGKVSMPPIDRTKFNPINRPTEKQQKQSNPTRFDSNSIENRLVTQTTNTELKLGHPLDTGSSNANESPQSDTASNRLSIFDSGTQASQNFFQNLLSRMPNPGPGPGPEPDPEELPFVDSLPDMNATLALETINENFAQVDSASNGEIDKTGSIDDLKKVAENDSGDYDEELQAAAQFLLDNPTVFDMMEVLKDGDSVQVVNGRQTQTDNKFSQEEIQIFLEGQQQLKVIIENQDVIDTSQTGGSPDGVLSENDFKDIVNKKDRDGNYVHSQKLRDAAQFMLDNDRFYDLVDAAATRGQHPGISLSADGQNSNSPDGDISGQDLYLAALQMQIYADDPKGAREFLMNADPDILDNFKISDEGSIPDEGLRATTAAALRDVDNMDEVIDLILELPETNGGFRNELITAVYADIGVKFDEFLGEDSGANWAIWGVPASTKVGDVIRNDQVVEKWGSNNGATSGQRSLMAEGNLLLFRELAPELNRFYETFGDHTEFDQQAIDEFMDSFPNDKHNLAKGFEAYYHARFATDPKEKQELTLVGNYYLVTHEQAKIDPILDEVLEDLPLQGDLLDLIPGTDPASDAANGAVVVEYPGRPPSSVANDVPPHDPEQAAYDNLVLDYDNIDHPIIKDFLDRYTVENNADPRNLENTDAKPWHDYNERMYYIYQDWREHHTDKGLFEMAESSGLDSVDYG